jgi:hypothetical protein
MDKNQKMEPQEAPLKNTDNAFVQVSKDGSPAIPGNDQISQDDIDAEQQRKEAMSERD